MTAREEFSECCSAQRWFVDEGWVEKQVAVDNLQLLAHSAGYVDELGQDEVQAIMAWAFSGDCLLEPEDEHEDSSAVVDILRRLEMSDPRDAWKWSDEPPPPTAFRNRDLATSAISMQPASTPQSTIDAFHVVLSGGDPERLAAWLRDHPDDVSSLFKLVEAA